MTRTDGTVLVLGASGKSGRRVVERLGRRGVPTRRGSRRGEPPFDWLVPGSWPAVLEGVSSVYVTFQPDMAVPGASDVISAFTTEAVSAGVERVVLLSGRGEAEAGRCEQVVLTSSLEATVVRSAWFAQDFSEDFLAASVRAGEVALPARDVAEPFVDLGDVADVVVAALTEEGHGGRCHEVTGPRALTFAEAAREVGEAAGFPVRFRRVSEAEFRSVLTGRGTPDEVVGMLLHLFDEVLDGRNAGVTGGVREVLGREPVDFREYARGAARAGAWEAHAGSRR